MTKNTFSDVLLEPQYSEIMSRSDVDLTSDMGKFTLALPVISANMKDITGPKMSTAMFSEGGMGILHRFVKEEESSKYGYVEDLQSAASMIYDINKKLDWTNRFSRVGVSVGVQDSDYIRFEKLCEAGAKIFCVDVAHGHHILVKNMIKYMRESAYYGNQHNGRNDDLCIIAGNVATVKGASDLIEWGADIIKVGIGPGGVCMTRKNTGIGVPQLHALKAIREANPDIKMIADGGIQSTGDIAKALVHANAVMVGSFIAGTSETPGHVYETPDGQYYKVYGGSASGERKVQNGQSNKHVEGVVKMIPFRGKVKYRLRTIKENLQSAFSYTGANNLKEFQERAVLNEISGGGKAESKL